MLPNNILAVVITFALILVWLRILDFAAHRGWISSHLSRKLIHTGTGPVFVLCWLMFTDAPVSPYLAALVPFAITLQFLLVGLGVIRDAAAVKALSRSGDRREILKGPLYYGIIFVLLTIFYWKTSPIGMVALMVLSGGDGLADIIGRRFGYQRLPWNPGKSWAGSLGMFLGGWGFSLLILWIYHTAGIFPQTLSVFFLPVTFIALVSTLVETLPTPDLDNITVTVTALVLGHLLLA
jgi:phytol kinase